MPNKPDLEATFAPAIAAATPQLDNLAAREAWAIQIIADLRAAQARMDAAWDQRLQDHPDADDAEFDAMPLLPEEAEVEAIHAQINAVLKHDRWPRHLYRGGV